MRTRGWIALALLAVAALLLIGRAATSLIVDRTWFAAFNADGIFWEQFVDTVLLRGGLWLMGSVFAFLNVYAVRKTILRVAVPSRVGNLDIPEIVPSERLLAYTLFFAAVIGVIVALPFADWTLLASVRHGVPFQEIEGYYSRDLGFYVYWLPFEETLYIWALLAVVIVSGAVIVLYAITRSLRMEGRRIIASTYVRRHLTVLSAIVMLLLAWSYRLDGYDLLRYGSGGEGLFLRVDHVVTITLDRVLAISMACASLILLRAGWLGHVRTALVTLTIVLVGSLGVRHLVPAIISRTSIIGDPGRREQDYIATRALFSRRAFNVDGIMPATSDSADITPSQFTLASLAPAFSVWDATVLMRAAKVQSSTSTPVDPIGWTGNNNAIQALVVERPAVANGAWSVLRIEGGSADGRGSPITNGAEPATQVDSTSFVAEDDASGAIQEPLVFPGATGHRLIVDSTTRIIGARLDSWTARVAHAWVTRDPRMLGDDTTETIPTIVQWRDVRARVRRLAPILTQGSDVSPLIFDGTLYWTVELYSASEGYPLSMPLRVVGDVFSYFQHAATALVNSKTGRVQFVTVANPDPVARTWMAIAPSLFIRVNRLPAGLAELLPPPTDGAIVQIRTFARYGSRLDGPAVRHFADSSLWSGDTPSAQLIAGRTASVGWSVPLLDGPEQVGGLAMATGGTRRGVHWAPTVAPFSRWSTLTRQLRDALDSARLSLAENGRREPRVNLGHFRTALVGGSPVLIQPMYMDRLNGAPALVRVAVATSSATAVGTSIADAVRRLPGGASGPGLPSTTPHTAQTAASHDANISRLYDAMRSAMQRGDFARFGSAFDSLGTLLGKTPR